ncbi:MAG: Ig-like domain-containing protein, partial [Candidatus Eisenbacteria bacterium]|nr:Ig-like domain-containing protein [Candidatus Eisenbacteria bacterium]
PYAIMWNTANTSNGSHTLKAKAEGSNATAENEITVIVNNMTGEIAVAVQPATAVVQLGATRQFTAIVTGTTNTGVTWSVDSGSSFGTINASGLYTAPAALPNPATAVVRATSAADPSKSGTAQITLTETGGEISVSITPPTATVTLGQTQQFSAQVTGTTDTGVTWSVDSGSSFGSVNASGLYTAPAALPNPATAVVRATSTADPSKSGTAQVTLQSSGGVPTEEKELIQEIFDTAYSSNELTEESISLAAQAVWGATELNGGSPTFTGTLTQSAPNSEDFTYSPTPNDRLIVLFSGSPAIEFVFTQFDGYVDGTWEDFLDEHELDFTVFIQDQMNFRIQSEKGSVGYGHWQWQRRSTGSVVYNDETLQIDIVDEGDQTSSVDSGWAESELTTGTTGTVTSPTASITVNQSYWSHLIHNSGDAVEIRNFIFRNGNTASFNGSNYQFVGEEAGRPASVRWEAYTHFGSGGPDSTWLNTVSEPDYWLYEGGLLKDGAVYGLLQFTGPVISGTWGPDLELHTAEGDILLHSLINMP